MLAVIFVVVVLLVVKPLTHKAYEYFLARGDPADNRC